MFVLANLLPSLTLTVLVDNVVRISSEHYVCTPAPNGTLHRICSCFWFNKESV